jgi:hypothetical protein
MSTQVYQPHFFCCQQCVCQHFLSAGSENTLAQKQFALIPRFTETGVIHAFFQNLLWQHFVHRWKFQHLSSLF